MEDIQMTVKMDSKSVCIQLAEKVLGWKYKKETSLPQATKFVDTEYYARPDGLVSLLEEFKPNLFVSDAMLLLDAYCKANELRAVFEYQPNQVEITFRKKDGSHFDTFVTAHTLQLAITYGILSNLGLMEPEEVEGILTEEAQAEGVWI